MTHTDELFDLEEAALEESDFFDDEDEIDGEASDYLGEGDEDRFGDLEGDPWEGALGEEEFETGDFETGDFETVVGEPDLFADFEDDGELGDLEGSEWDTEYEKREADAFDEDDEFFKSIGRFVKKAARGVGRLVKRGVRTLGRVAGPLFKVFGPIAAKIVGTAIGGPAGAAIASTIASNLLKEAEYEDEADAESAIEEDEALLQGVGVDEASYDMMADAAFEMSEAEDERAANRALVRMVGHAMRGFGSNRRLRPHLPRIMRAAIALARTFRANRKTRWAVGVIPLIVARTVLRLSRARRITQRTLVEAMSRETAWVLANPARARAAMRTMARRRSQARRNRPRRRVRRRS